MPDATWAELDRKAKVVFNAFCSGALCRWRWSAHL